MSAELEEDPLEVIPDAEAEYLFMHTDRLPTATRNFIRLQNEIAYRDTGETLSMLSPTLIESKYAIKGVRFRKLRSKQEKEEYLRRFLEEMEKFFHEVFHTYARAEAAEAYFQKVEQYIETTLKVMDKHQLKAFAPVIQEVRAELEQAKQEILEHKDTLTSQRLPNLNTVRQIDSDLDAKVAQLKQTTVSFKERFRNFLHYFDHANPTATPTPPTPPTTLPTFPAYYTPPVAGAPMFTPPTPTAGGGSPRPATPATPTTPPASSTSTTRPSTSTSSARKSDDDDEDEAPPGPTYNV
jgi:hypothetical protein